MNQRKQRTRNLPSSLPATMPKATRFTADPVMGTPDWSVQQVNALVAAGQIMDVDAAIKALQQKDSGRRRVVGSPFKAFVGYTASKKVGMQTFWGDYGQNRLWKDAGFKFRPGQDMYYGYRPAFQSLYRWFEELEDPAIVDVIERAGDELIQIARRNDPEIGRNVALDFTAFLSPNRAYHVCRGCKCPRANGKQRKSRARMHTQTQRADAQFVSKQRHNEAETEPIPVRSEERREIRKRHRRTFVDRHGRKFVIWRNSRGCLLICLDTSAGGRSYDEGRIAWVGGYRGRVSDLKYGGTLATVSFGAHRREHAGVAALIRKTERALGGERPEALSADRGVSMASVFYLLERRNIDPIIPWRVPNQNMPTMAHERTADWDEDGPRCKHCGGPTTMNGPRLGRAIIDREPYVRFRCLLGLTPDCSKMQQIACRERPTILTGVAKDSERYQALVGMHGNSERGFNEDRARFGLSGKDLTLRLRRRGVEAQRLRAAVARYLEWLYICLRHGWLGSHAYRNTAKAVRRGAMFGVRRFKGIREKLGLLLPYGPAAFKLGLAATPEIPKPPPPRPKKKRAGGP